MRCERTRKRLSDELDGPIPARAKARLDRHLAGCPACRAYRDDLTRLQEGTPRPAGLAAGAWADFERRLASRLASVEPGGTRVAVPGSPARRWAIAAAGVLVAAAAGVFFAVGRPDRASGTAWLPYEETLTPILLEAEADPEFGALVDQEVLASLEDMIPPAERESALPAAEDPLFWEGLSEKELLFIAAEMEKQSGHGGPK